MALRLKRKWGREIIETREEKRKMNNISVMGIFYKNVSPVLHCQVKIYFNLHVTSTLKYACEVALVTKHFL